MQHKIKMLISISVLAVSTSFAQTAITATPEELALVQKVGQGNLTVLSAFKASDNLTGLMVQVAGRKPMIVYVDNQAKYGFFGSALFAADGTNLTQKDMETYVAPYTAKKVAEGLSQVTAVTEGSDKAPNKMIVVVEANCSACNSFYKRVKPFIDNGQLQISWVFVYFLKPDSEAKAAAIMTAKDPAVAMAKNEKDFVMKTESGGIEALKEIPPATAKQLEANETFMKTAGISGTPTLIYSMNGKLTVGGMTNPDVAAFLKEVNPQLPSQIAKK